MAGQVLLIPNKVLGTGAMGSVYLAHDSQGGPHAVKVLKGESPGLLPNFESEVGFLAKLRHPRLVGIEGFSKFGEGIQGMGPSPCFWMEYVDGVPLLSAAAQAGVEAILEWLRECLEALEYLHSQGILHGDLKPANILVTRTGHVKLVDFGLASFSQSLERASSGKGVQGSVPYLAPEVIRGDRLPASDLFALGTIFYQALAGTHPRHYAKNLQELFSSHFKALRDYSNRIPSRAARVIERMIEADLGRRLQSAKDARAALTEDSAPDEPGFAADTFYPFEMLGVAPTLERFWKFLADRQEKAKPALILLHGLSGSGKTRLLRELSFDLSLRGQRTAQVTPEPGKKLFPEPTASQLSAGILLFSHAERLQTPHLGELFHFLKAAEGKERPSGPHALVLEYGEEGLRPELEGFFSGIQGQEGVLDLRLHPLSLEDSRSFLRRALNLDLPEEAVQAIFDRTHGFPALLTEACRHLVSVGIHKKRHLSPALFREFTLPEGFSEIFAQRLKKASADEFTILQYLALTAGAVPTHYLEGLVGITPMRLREALRKLGDLGLTKVDPDSEPGAYLLAHPMLGELIVGEMSHSQRRDLHRSWLSLLEKDPSRQNTIRLAHHALQLPEYAGRVAWVLQAGEILVSQEEPQRALALYEKCLALPIAPEERDTLLRTTANTYGATGQFGKAKEFLEKWFGEFKHDPIQLNPLKFYLATGVQTQNLGDPAEARRRYDLAVKQGDPKHEIHRPLLARAHSLLGLLDIAEGGFAEARGHFRQAMDLLPSKSPESAELWKHQATLAVKQGNWQGALADLEKSRSLYEALADWKGLFSVALERGNLALKMGMIQEAESAYTLALGLAEQHQEEALLARIHQNRGVIASWRGQYYPALEELEKAREIFAFLGNPHDRATNLLELAWVYAALGGFSKAAEILARARMDPSVAGTLRRRLEQIEAWMAFLKGGESPGPLDLETDDRKNEVFSWDLERRLMSLQQGGGPDPSEEIRALLTAIYKPLPDPWKISFEERSDWKRWILGETDLSTSTATEETSMDTLQRLSAINRELLSASELDQVLEKILDAAMELTQAERGFLVTRTQGSGGVLPGFEIQVAKNLSKEMIESQTSDISLSAVREAMDQGEALVTDNALKDVRFEEAESVHHLELKSILALPLKGTSGVIGALYLDHRFETERFRGADLILIQAFADQAALALQKAQMIQELKRANRQLSQTVEVQETELSALKREVEDQRQKLTFEYKEVVGASPAMLEVLSLVDRITETSVPVWIFGESGTGKEMIARALHYNSGRAKKAFVSENCSALPETLLESELFGHKKGAFTHADRDKKGLLEYAHGGTIFLDEIADMSPSMQAKMLRFLQEGEIRPLGANQVMKVDVRVVSASNKDLEKLIREEKFREDLYYRLNGVTVSLPPLRERSEDLPLLVQHFLKKFAKDEKREPYEITADALEVLMEYPWPGNVRELENAIRTACLFHQKGKLVLKSFNFKKPLFGGGAGQRISMGAASEGKGKAGAAPRSGAAKGITDEKRLLLEALYEHGYHKGHAADALGISRRYLYTQMMRHGIPANRIEMKAYIQDQLSLK